MSSGYTRGRVSAWRWLVLASALICGCPGTPDDPDDGPVYSGSTQHAPWTLVFLTWDGEREQVVLQNTSNSAIKTIGDLGDFASWSTDNAVVSQDGATLYSVGYAAEGPQKLYVFDLVHGQLRSSDDIGRNFSGFGAEAPDRRLIAATVEDDMSCALTAIGPAGAATSPYLTVAPACTLALYHSPVTSVDHRTLYWRVGPSFDPSRGDQSHHLVSVDLRSATITKDVSYQDDWTTALVGGDASGRLIGIRFSGVAEEVVVIDPATATSNTIGVLGDLYSWYGGAQLSPDGTMLYVQGMPEFPSEEESMSKIYIFDLTHNTYVGELVDKLGSTLVGVIGDGIYQGGL